MEKPRHFLAHRPFAAALRLHLLLWGSGLAIAAELFSLATGVEIIRSKAFLFGFAYLLFCAQLYWLLLVSFVGETHKPQIGLALALVKLPAFALFVLVLSTFNSHLLISAFAGFMTIIPAGLSSSKQQC